MIRHRLVHAGLLLAALFSAALPAVAAPGDRLDRSKLVRTFAEEFATTADAKAFVTSYPQLRTNFYFGYQARDKGQDWQFQSRAYPGTRNVMVDGVYMPGACTPHVMNGMLYLNAYPLLPKDKMTAGQGKRDFASALVTTQGAFAQTFGYFEIKAKLPEQSGTWPAFWLLPVEKTVANQGRLAEVDVFEHYGGTKTVMSGTTPVVIDRVGRPFSTVHTLIDGVEKNMGRVPTDRIDLKQFHTFGVLWTPAEFVFYVDDRETFRTPNPGVSDSHYMVVNLDISENAGAVDPKLKTSLIVDWMRAWRIGG